MTLLRVFPFIGALIAIAAVVLAIIGVSTTYWFAPGAGAHSGRIILNFFYHFEYFFFGRSLAKLCR